ncbi:MAG: hypothetical protein FWH32_04450 [Clostridiales bacterium]|nr:hypothetical protein [Clostridiales bacterium]
MVIIDSARKHGISDVDIAYVYEFPLNSIVTQEEPIIVMLFGFDTIGRSLEIAYITNDEGEDIVIHAMKIRPSYNRYLYDRKGSV